MTAEQKKGRRQFMALVVIFLGPVVVAAALYFGGVDLTPRGSVAHGELVSPIVEIPVVESTFRGEWTLAVVDQTCAESCLETLIKIRQVRLALGREMDRIARVLVLTGDDVLPDDVVQGQPGLVVFDQDSQVTRDLAAKFGGDAANSLYLIDPLGNLMMRFERGIPPKDLKTDLKRLLKLSSIG